MLNFFSDPPKCKVSFGRQVSRQVGLFRCHTNMPKKITMQLKNYEKQLKNLWQQGQHKKAAQLYVHCGPLEKIYRTGEIFASVNKLNKTVLMA